MIIAEKEIRGMRSIFVKLSYHVYIHDDMLVRIAPAIGGGGEL